MECIKHWWAISREGRLSPPQRTVWLTNRTTQKFTTTAFILSFLTIAFVWYLFMKGLIPQFQTKSEMLYVASLTPLRAPVMLTFLISYALGNLLYGGSYGHGIAPAVLIFKPQSFCEAARALLVLIHEIMLLVGIGYFGPIALLCEFLGMLSLGVK